VGRTSESRTSTDSILPKIQQQTPYYEENFQNH